MKHRGPDGEQIYLAEDGSFGLARRDLVTINWDPSGSQPACDSAGKIWVVSDGPIYNFKELSERVSKKASIPPPQTQGELIAELFRLEGTLAFRMIDGECAFALMDTSAWRFYLVRDGGGVRGLYYALKGGRCLFASEPRALLVNPAVTRELDEQAFLDYMTLLFTPPPRTLFRDIRKLPQATFVCIDHSGLRRETYWNPLEVDLVKGREVSYYVEAFKEKLRRAVEKRCNNPGMVGVPLGGIDSAALGSVAAAVAPGRVHTVTYDMRLPKGVNAGQDELVDLHYARETAEALGVTHHEFLLEPKDLPHSLARFVDSVMDDLVLPHLLFWIPVAEISRENGAKVVFSGMPSYMYSSGVMPKLMIDIPAKWDSRLRLPGVIRRLMSWAAERTILQGGPDEVVINHRREFWRNLGRGYEMYWVHKPGFCSRAKEALLAREVWKRSEDPWSYDYIGNVYHHARQSRADVHTRDAMYLVDLMNVTDRMDRVTEISTAAGGVELREPYLDKDLLEFAFATPYEIKNMSHKFLIEKSVEGVLSDEIIHRKKAGSGVPVDEHMKIAMPRILRRVIKDAAPDAKALFNPSELERIIRFHEKGKPDIRFQTLALMGFFLWHRRWIEGKLDTAAFISECFDFD
ncbi:MAG: asparagine synthase-related protein [Planctomycetota bacterium]